MDSRHSSLWLKAVSIVVIFTIVFPTAMLNPSLTQHSPSAEVELTGLRAVLAETQDMSTAEVETIADNTANGTLTTGPTPVPTREPTPQPTPQPRPEFDNRQPYTTTAILDSRGNTILTSDGLIQIHLPAAALRSNAEVILDVRPTFQNQTPGSRWLTFDISPSDASRLTEGHLLFEKPITVTLDLTEFPAWLDPYVVQEDDAALDTWTVIQSDFDEVTRQLSFQVERFSELGVSGVGQVPDDGAHYLITNLPNVDTFSGGAGYSYPLALPAGRSGLTPQISLSYNSAGINGMFGIVQSNYIGFGWNVGGLMAITRQIETHAVTEEGQYPLHYKFSNEFALNMGGTSYQLSGYEMLDNNGGCRYYAPEAPGLLIMRYTDTDYCGYGEYSAISDNNVTKEFWVVTTADGTTYEFGTTIESEQIVTAGLYDPSNCTDFEDCGTDTHAGYNISADYSSGYGGENAGNTAYRWSVSFITDTYGNGIQFGYYEDNVSGLYDDTDYWDRAQYPAYIRYTQHANASPAYVVEFVRERRCDSNDYGTSTCATSSNKHDVAKIAVAGGRNWALWDDFRIDKIKVCKAANATAVNCNTVNPLVQYDLDYEFVEERYPGLLFTHGSTEPFETTRLVSITRTGWNSSGNSENFDAVTEFWYGDTSATPDHGSFLQGLGDAQGNVDMGTLLYPRLQRVENGYGAELTLNYNNDATEVLNHNYILSYRVKSTELTDGMGNTSFTTYDYAGTCYSSIDELGANCRDARYQEATYALVGHSTVTTTLYEYDDDTTINSDDLVLSQTVSKFHTTNDPTNGKPKSNESLDSQGDPLTTSETLWATYDHAPTTTFQAESTYLVQSLSWDHTGSGDPLMVRTDTEYDEYGNVTLQGQYSDPADMTDGSFEDALISSDWISNNFQTLPVLSTDHAVLGNQSLKLTGDVNGSGGTVYQDLTDLAQGDTYKVQVFVRNDNYSTMHDTYLIIHDDDASTSDTFLGTRVTPSVGWTVLTGYYTINSNGKMRIAVSYKYGGGGTDGALYVDNFTAVKVAREVTTIYENLDDVDHDDWRIGLPVLSHTWDGFSEVDGLQLASSAMFYDNEDRYSDPLDQTISDGQLVEQASGFYTETTETWDPAKTWSIITYDAYGNVATTEDALGNTSVITYDTTYKQFPIQLSAGGLTNYTNYYGVNDVITTTTYYGLFGQVQRTYESNGPDVATLYNYDAFGRQTAIIRPGDSVTYPTAEYYYDDSNSYGLDGSRIIIKQRVTSGQSDTMDARYIYDALGRNVQTRTNLETSNSVQSVTNFEYNALGQAVRQYHPQEENFASYFKSTSIDDDLPLSMVTSTATQQESRAADGTTSSQIKYGRRTISIDANGHRRDAFQNEYGETIQVTEYLADPEQFEAETDHSHQCSGSTVGTTWQASTSANSGGCYLSYGPYETPTEAADAQVVRFRLSIENASDSSDKVARIEVNDHTDSNRVIASRELTYRDFVGGYDKFSEFDLVFDATGLASHQLEYRVWFYDEVGVAHDWTKVIWTDNGIDTEYTYDATGALIEVEDALGNITEMTYDPLNRKISMDDPDMGEWSYEYDVNGNLTEQTDARGCTTTFAYDSLGRVTEKSFGTGCSGSSSIHYSYDDTASVYGYSQGHLTRSYTGRLANMHTYEYDTRGRVISETLKIDGTPYTTQYTYDAMDRVVTTTYPDGEVVTTDYGYAGMPESLTSNSAPSTPLVDDASYNHMGQITSMTRGNNLTTEYIYNPLSHRLTNMQTEYLLSFSYTYDNVGNIERVDEQRNVTFVDRFDDLDTSNWTYNISYQSIDSDWEGDKLENAGTGSSWSATFNRSSDSLSSGEAMQVRFKCEESNCDSTQVLHTSGSPEYRFGVYINDSIRVQVKDDSGYSYPLTLIDHIVEDEWYVLRISVDDVGGFTVEIYMENDASTFISYSETMPTGYDWSFINWVYAGTVYYDDYFEYEDGTQASEFEYDELDRLTGAEATAADSIPAYSRTWTYDSIGNITDRTTENGAQSWDYDYSNSNYGPHAVNTVDFTTGADWTFQYDANGNMTSRVNNTGIYTLTYNAENKLATAAVGDTTITYTYDANGTLVKKVTDDGTNTTTDLYIGGHYAIMDGTIRKTYMFNGQAVAVKNGATLEYLLGDHLDSASVSTNTSGNVTSEQRYYPYGEVRWSTGSDMPTDYTYTAQREDFYTQLYDFGARYYDSQLGRFIQADTIVPDPGNSQTLNRYMFTRGNPIKYNDPSGHDVGCPGQSLENCTPSSTETYEFTDGQWDAINQWSAYFDIPPEFLAAVLAAEILYDTDWHDGPTDIVIGGIAIIGTSGYPHLQGEAAMAEAFLYQVEDDFLIPLVGLSYGGGIGQIHAPTARAAEGHFGDTFPTSAKSSSDLYAQLTSDSGNFKYTAAILRMYADQRPVSRNDQGEMIVDEAGAVFANYHETVDTVFGSDELYKAGGPPTESGQYWVDQLRPLLIHYQNLLGR